MAYETHDQRYRRKFRADRDNRHDPEAGDGYGQPEDTLTWKQWAEARGYTAKKGKYG